MTRHRLLTRRLSSIGRVARLLFIVVVMTGFSGHVAGTEAEKDKPKAEKPSAPAPIALAQIAEEADVAATSLRKMVADESARKELTEVETHLPILLREVNARERENKGILAQSPSLELLRNLDARWQDVRARLAEAADRLQRLLGVLNQQLKLLETVEKTWAATASHAAEENAPREVAQRITSLLADLASTRKYIEGQRTAALKLQTRVSDLEVRVTESLEANRKMREATVGRMFARDSAPLWDRTWREDARARIVAGTGDALESQWVLLQSYLEPQSARVGLHIALLAALAGLFYWVRQRLNWLVIEEPRLRRAATVVQYPIASALIIALLINHWVYPQAPRLLWAITGIAVLAPTIFLLRKLVVRALRVPLYAVLGFYIVDQARTVSASVDMLPRVLFVTEMLAVAVLLVWFRRKVCAAGDELPPQRYVPLLRVVATGAIGICVATALANAAGYVALANLVGGAVLDSMYAALVLYAVVQILDALVEIATRVRPLTALHMVRTHREKLEHRFKLLLRWIAVGIWALYVMDLLAVRERVIDALHAALDAHLRIGEIEISLSAVLSFVLAVWAAFIVSRLVRFVLNEEIFPHASLKRGVPYAISRTIHFLIIAVGFFVAMGIIGMEMTQFTLLASAFTIGVGFGLQNIFNNFVSGLIVLFERPVQVGDVIQIDDAVGVVQRIGIRASVVSTPSGSQVIVPNGKLISDRVVNWTLSGRRRVIELPISVVLQSDPQKVITILEAVAKQHPAVLDSPPVQAIVTRLGPDWMGFELRAAIGEVEGWMRIRSELAISATAALREAEVTLR